MDFYLSAGNNKIKFAKRQGFYFFSDLKQNKKKIAVINSPPGSIQGKWFDSHQHVFIFFKSCWTVLHGRDFSFPKVHKDPPADNRCSLSRVRLGIDKILTFFFSRLQLPAALNNTFFFNKESDLKEVIICCFPKSIAGHTEAIVCIVYQKNNCAA